MDELELKVGRLADKLRLYEPILVSLPGIAALPARLDQINKDIRILTDSRIAVREQLVTLFKAQSKGYDEIVKKLEEESKAREKEVGDCPIKDVAAKQIILEQDMAVVKLFDGRIDTIEETLDSFKLKGWDLLFKIAPWVIASCTTLWAVLKT